MSAPPGRWAHELRTVRSNMLRDLDELFALAESVVGTADHMERFNGALWKVRGSRMGFERTIARLLGEPDPLPPAGSRPPRRPTDPA